MTNTSPSRLTIWFSKQQESPDHVSRSVEARTFLGSDGIARDQLTDGVSAVIIQAICGSPGSIGVLLLPTNCYERVAQNCVPLEPGAHLLRHGDRIDVGGARYWVSQSALVETTAYDPALQGEDVFCFLTKARLAAGQAITVCPGPPGKSCGAIYKAEAWKLTMQAGGSMKCPNCGYRPDQADWTPPQPRTRRSLDAVRKLITC